MFAYIPSPNSDPVIVVGIALIALVVLGFVLWSAFAEEESSEKGWRRIRPRRKQKTRILAAPKPKTEMMPRAKFKSSTILGSIDLPPVVDGLPKKPKSEFSMWMHSETSNQPVENKPVPQEKPPEGKKHDLVA